MDSWKILRYHCLNLVYVRPITLMCYSADLAYQTIFVPTTEVRAMDTYINPLWWNVEVNL